MKKSFSQKAYKLILLLLSALLIFMSANISVGASVNEGSDHSKEAQVAENQYYKLEVYTYGEKCGSFSVVRKSDGKVWHSNPAAATSQDGEILAQLSCTLYNRDTKSEISVNSYTATNNGNKIFVKKNNNALEITYDFDEYGIEIPLIISLDDKEITASVNSADIVENGEFVVMSIGVLPYFFAGGADEEGKILVPDGSGAVINFNNGKTGSAEFSQPLYGTQLDYYKQTEVTSTEKAHLPIFAIMKNASSLLAIVEKGDGACTVKSRVAGMFNDYNIVYGEFKLRARDILVMGDSRGNTMNGEKFDLKNKMFDVASVRYCLLGENENYYSIAKEYANHLDIDKQKIDASPKTFLEVYAGCIKKISFLGIPMSKYYPLTTLDELSDIVEELDDNGAVSVIYRNADTALSSGKLQNKVSLRNNLGSLKKLKALKKKLGGGLYYEYNPFNITKSGNGFTKKFNSSKRISQDLMTENTFLKSTYYVNSSVMPRYIMKPELIGKYSKKMFASADKNGIDLAFTTLGNTLYTNFAEKKYSTRNDTMNYITDALSKHSGLIYSPNAYSLKYAKEIVDLPTQGSGFDIVDEEIPFYQLVLNGLSDYAVTSINLSENYKEIFLKALATASSLKFTVIHESIDDEKNIDFTNLYGASYSSNKKAIVEMQKQIKEVYSKIGSRKIKDFYSPANKVWCTVFENGKTLCVNMSQKDVTVNNSIVSTMSYLILNGG